MHQRNDSARLLTTSEAAEQLGVSRSTVLNWCKAGNLSAVQYPSGQWRIAASTVAQILTPKENAADVSESGTLPGQRELF